MWQEGERRPGEGEGEGEGDLEAASWRARERPTVSPLEGGDSRLVGDLGVGGRQQQQHLAILVGIVKGGIYSATVYKAASFVINYDKNTQ